MTPAYLAVDFGTTNLKAAAFSPSGKLLDCLHSPTPLVQEDGRGCYPPERVKEAVFRQLCTLGERFSVQGIAVTGMAEAGLMLDRASMQPLSPILPWFDPRTQALAQEQEPFAKRHFLRTGLHNSYKFGMYKYLWLLRESGRKPQDTLWMSACDWLAYLLCQSCVTDPTFAARTYFYDLAAGSWDERLLAELGLSVQNLPALRPSGALAGTLREGILPRAGGIPVVLAGHDHLCAAYMLERLHPGCVCDSMGTAQTFVGLFPKAPLGEAAFSSGLNYGPFVQEGTQFWMANLPASGASVEWARGMLQKQEITYPELEEALAGEPSGLLYFPFLTGSGTPSYRAEARAACIGLSTETGWRELLRGVVEGVSMQERLLLRLALGEENRAPICVVGGAARSDAWMQLKADILEREVICTQVSEGTLLGAAALMCSRLGLPFSPAPDHGRRFLPKDSGRYAGAYERYSKLVNDFI